MKRKLILYSLLLLSIFVLNAESMEIVSQSKFPLNVYYSCEGQPKRSISIISDVNSKIDQACCVTKIELKGYSDYSIEQDGPKICTPNTLFTIVQEIDQVFVLKAYNENNSKVLEFFLENGLDPLTQLSNNQIVSSLTLENNSLMPIGMLAPTVKLRGAPSGNGIQRYKALLPAAIYDGKVDIVNVILKNTKVNPERTFNGNTLLQIAEFSRANKLKIKEALEHYFAR